MLSKLIVNSYKMFIEISLWLSLLFSINVAWLISSIYSDEFISVAVAVAVLIWFIVAVVVFGTFLVLEDIRQRVKNIEALNFHDQGSAYSDKR